MLRNKFRYLMLLASVALLLIFFNKYYIGMIFLTIVMMPFFLFGLLSYSYGKVKAELVSMIHVANKGDRIPISVQLSNPTIFPVSFIKLYVTYKNSYSAQKFKKTICASLDYRTKTSVIFHLTSQYAGNLEITLEGIRIYDYMKLFSLKRKLKNEIKVAVLPAYYEVEYSEVLNRNTRIVESENYSPYKKGDDPSEVFEIREYREGDRLQRVHWKLSFKQNQLMMKEFSDPEKCSELLFINLCIPEDENRLFCMDTILECALSLSYSLVLHDHMHYLSWYDVSHGACRRVRVVHENDLFEAVDGLLHSKPYQDSTDALTAYLAEYPHDQYSALYFISHTVSEQYVDSFSAIKAYNKQMIYMHGGKNEATNSEEELKLLMNYKDIGVEFMMIDSEHLRSDMEQLSS